MTPIDKLREALDVLEARAFAGRQPEHLEKPLDQARAALDELATELETFRGDSVGLAMSAVKRGNEICNLKARVRELEARPAETDEQATERELGAWLVAHPGSVWLCSEYSPEQAAAVGGAHTVSLHWGAGPKFGECARPSALGIGHTKAAAIRDALKKAKQDG